MLLIKSIIFHNAPFGRNDMHPNHTRISKRKKNAFKSKCSECNQCKFDTRKKKKLISSRKIFVKKRLTLFDTSQKQQQQQQQQIVFLTSEWEPNKKRFFWQ